MADFDSDNTYTDAQNLGELVIDDTNFPSAFEGFDVQGSVGFDEDEVWGNPGIYIADDTGSFRYTTLFFYSPERSSTALPNADPIDYFQFTPNGVEEVEVNFRIFENQDGFSSLVVVPVSGVSNTAGAIVYNTSAPEDDPSDEATALDPDAYPSFKAREDLFVSGYSIGEDLNGVEDRVQHYSLDPIGGEATATWTLTGDPVTFAVFGFNGDTDISDANPEDLPRNTINGELLSISYLDYVVLDEAEYRIRLFPTEGELPDPTPTPQPTPTPEPTPIPVAPDPGLINLPPPDLPADYDCVAPQNVFDNGQAATGSNFVNDFLIAECITGTGEVDVYFAVGNRDEFVITESDDLTVYIEDTFFPGIPDRLSSIERIEFDDGVLALDVNETAGQAYRLYQAAFDREPDTPGLIFWIGVLDAGSVDLQGTAEFFMQSEEFAQRYGTASSISDERFIELLYNNVLYRDPDQAGYDFWTGVLDDGNYSRERTLVDFSESPENQSNVIDVIGTGIWLPDFSYLGS